MIVPPYALFLAVLFFYAVEHIKFVDKNTVVICFQRDRSFKFLFPTLNFTLLRRHIVILTPLINSNFVLGKFIPAGDGLKSSNRFVARNEEIRSLGKVLSFLERAYFFQFAVIFPTLVLSFGLNRSIICVLVAHFATYAAMVFVIVFKTPTLIVPKSSRLSLSLELLVSPGLMLSLTKRLYSGYTINDFDGVQSLVSNLKAPDRERTLSKIRDRLDDYVLTGEITTIQRSAYLDPIES